MPNDTPLRALLATGRISNLPTVWSHVLVAHLLTQQALGVHFYLTAFIASLLYVAGCFLGDALDAGFDATHRPSRPIPSGILSKKAVLLKATALFTTTLLFTLLFTPSSPHASQRPIYYAALFITVIAYSFFHKKIPALALPLIALCRACLIFYAAGRLSPLITLYALASALYTIGFALVARQESSPSKITFANLLFPTMLLIPLLSQLSLLSLTNAPSHPTIWLGLIPIFAWLIYSFAQLTTNKARFVSFCLAGFCLLDLVFVVHASPARSLNCLGLFICALGLQHNTPAT